MPRFQVFRQTVQIERVGPLWQAHVLGTDGKRRPADFIVPAFVEEAELAQYLFDLFHEDAVPGAGDVRRIG